MSPQKIIRNYLTIAGLYTLSASLIWGVNTLFLIDAGLDIREVFVANAAFSAGMVLFEIPTGVIADTRGRRTSFLFSVTILAISTLGYVGVATAGGNLMSFIIMSVIMGLGFTFYSGAVEAWLVDALNASGYEGELDHVFARSSFVTGAAMLVGTIAGGVLGGLDLSVPFLARAGLLAAVFVIAYFTMHEIGFTPRQLKLAELPAEMKKVAKESIQYGWRERPIRLLMLLSFIQSSFFVWGFYAWPPYFLDLLGEDLVWVSGFISALIALSMMVGNGIVDWLARYCGNRTTLLLWAAGVQTAAIIGVGLAPSFWLAVPLLLISMVATGVSNPVQQSFIHRLIPSEQRATIISFNSMIGSSGSTIGQTGLGTLSQSRSIAAGYVAGGLSTFFALPVLFLLRRTKNEADIIIGKAGVTGTCAAKGLPSISAVETSISVS